MHGISLAPGAVRLFAESIDRLRQCYERNGHIFDDARDLEQQLWESLGQRRFAVKEGYRATLNRFQSCIAVAELHVPWWEVDRLERTHCAIEQDYLRGAAFLQKLRMQARGGDVGVEGGGTTSAGHTTLEDRTLRSCCQNAVAISVQLLSDDGNRRICEGVLAMGMPVKAWHSEQNRALRSADDSEAWIVGQLAGGWMAHRAKVIGQLCECEAFQRSGFCVLESSAAAYSPEDVGVEDERAELLAAFALPLASHRQKRGMWLLSCWPWRLCDALNGKEQSHAVIGEFRTVLEVYRWLQALEGKGKELSVMEHRRMLDKTSCEQFIQAFEDEAVRFSPAPEVLDLLRKMARPSESF